MAKNLVCVGKITSAHGIKGALKVKSFTQDPGSLADYSPLYSKDGKRVFELEVLSVKEDMLIVKLVGVDNRNDADNLRGVELFADKALFSDLEEDEFYYDDLIGVLVKLESGQVFGKILTVDDFGGGDVVEIKLNDSNKTQMFAFTKENFPEVNVKEGYVIICPPEVEFAQDNDN